MARASSASEKLAESEPVFAALADRTRLRLVARLSEGGRWSIARLTSGSKVSRQAVTKHLATLEGAGLVRSERRGREHLWELQAERLTRVGAELEAISRQWDRALERLRRYVEPA